MAVRIKPKRTATTGNAPTTSDLEAGEIAINLPDRIMYYRDTLNNIKTINIADLADFDTDDLTEGSNLYYTDARVYSAISGGTGVSIDGSGVISIGQAVSVTSDVTFNDVTVNGDLTVNGTTTTLNTTELTIEDNQIELNNGYSGSSPTANAGIIINRGGGTEADAEIRWNETLDRWELNDGTGYVEIASAGAVDLSGESISELSDVTVTGTPADNEVLAYDTTASAWINQTAAEASLATTTDIANSGNWDTAYSWGDHSVEGYLTSETSHADVVVDGDFASQGIMLRGATAGSYSILTDNSANWNTAYGWGDHSVEGYLTSETFTGTVTSVAQTVPTGFTVSGSPITTSGTLAIAFDTGYSLPTTASQTNWDEAYSWGDHSVEGYITSADGGNAATLDGIDSTSFLRSDTSDTFSGGRLTIDVANFGEATIIQRPSSGGTALALNNYQPTSYADGDETGAFNFAIGDLDNTFNLTGGAKMEYDSGQQHIFKLFALESNSTIKSLAKFDKAGALFFDGDTFSIGYASNTTTIKPNVSAETLKLASNDATDFIDVVDGSVTIGTNSNNQMEFTDSGINVETAGTVDFLNNTSVTVEGNQHVLGGGGSFDATLTMKRTRSAGLGNVRSAARIVLNETDGSGNLVAPSSGIGVDLPMYLNDTSAGNFYISAPTAATGTGNTLDITNSETQFGVELNGTGGTYSALKVTPWDNTVTFDGPNTSNPVTLTTDSMTGYQINSNDDTNFMLVDNNEINFTLNNTELMTMTDNNIAVNDDAQLIVRTSDFGTVARFYRVLASGGGTSAMFASELSNTKSGTGSSNIMFATNHTDGDSYNSIITGSQDGSGNRTMTLTTFTGVATSRDQIVMDELGIEIVQDIHQNLNASGTTTASYNLDISKNLHSYTLGANTTFTFTGSLAGGADSAFCTVKLTQGASAYTVTWPASVKWPGGATPTISTGSGDVDVVTMFTVDSGTTWYASIAQDFS